MVGYGRFGRADGPTDRRTDGLTDQQVDWRTDWPDPTTPFIHSFIDFYCQVQRLQEDHVKAIAQKDESDATHRLEIQRLQGQDKRLAQDLARAQEQNATLVEDNRSLASQLVLYQDDAKATSEMLVIKDAEVWLRLVQYLFFVG